MVGPGSSSRSAFLQELVICRGKALDQPCSTIDVNRLTRDRLIPHKKQYSLGNFICGHETRNRVFLCDVAERLRSVLREDMAPHRGICVTGCYGVEANRRKLQ